MSEKLNEVMKVIKERRSTRKYSKKAINEEDLNTIISAGLMAPSAHNNKGWHFTLVSNKELLEKMNIETKEIAKTCADDLYERWGNKEEFDIFYHAPTVLILSGDDKAYNSYIDCAAATENMLLAAESIGVGTCWIGVIELLFREKTKEYKELLNLPEGYTPLFAMTIGYKEGNSAKPPKLDMSVVQYIR
jgi:nitroreductase